jgi:hypothetical protein
VLFLANIKKMDLSFTYSPRNKKFVFGRKQKLVAKVLDKRKIQKITEHRVVEIVTHIALNL